MITENKINRILRENAHYESISEGLIIRENNFKKIAKSIMDKIRENEMGQETLNPEWENELLK